MVIFTWRDRQLKVDATVLMPFQEAESTEEADIKSSVSGGETIVSFKNRKAKNFSITVPLMAAAGADVKAEVKGWQSMVDGVAGRIYIGGEDLFERDMILTGCPATEIVFAGIGIMKSAKLKLTFQQAQTQAAANKSASAAAKNAYRASLTKEQQAGYDRVTVIADKAWDKTTKLSKEQQEKADKINADATLTSDQKHKQLSQLYSGTYYPLSKAQITSMQKTAADAIKKAKEDAQKKTVPAFGSVFVTAK